MHDGIQYHPIQGQGHTPLKVGIIIIIIIIRFVKRQNVKRLSWR